MVTNGNSELNKNGNRRGMSPNSRKNLPLGRKPNIRTAKDYSITRICKAIIDEPADERWLNVDDKGKGLTWRQAIAKSLLVGALLGKPTQLTELLERLEGKITQPVGGDKEHPLELLVRWDGNRNISNSTFKTTN